MTDIDLRHVPSELLIPDKANGHYHPTPYPFGIDPIWDMAENEIPYLNAYNMSPCPSSQRIHHLRRRPRHLETSVSLSFFINQ